MEFEKNLKRLEEIVQKMEGSELNLEESLTLFEEGIKLTKVCHKSLDEAELKVKKLIAVDDKGNAQTEDFASE